MSGQKRAILLAYQEGGRTVSHVPHKVLTTPWDLPFQGAERGYKHIPNSPLRSYFSFSFAGKPHKPLPWQGLWPGSGPGGIPIALSYCKLQLLLPAKLKATRLPSTPGLLFFFILSAEKGHDLQVSLSFLIVPKEHHPGQFPFEAMVLSFVSTLESPEEYWKNISTQSPPQSQILLV